MKGKKIFVLSILVVMMVIFFTGCEYDITYQFKESQKVAEEFLTTKGYEPPKGYEVRYLNENKKQLYVKTDVTEILFDISNRKTEMKSINVSGISEDAKISNTHIKQIEQVANDFLNTEGYNIPQEYSIKYLGKDKAQLQVELEVAEEKNELKIITNFSITEGGLEITNIVCYVDERKQGVVIYGLLIIIVVTILIYADKHAHQYAHN